MKQFLALCCLVLLCGCFKKEEPPLPEIDDATKQKAEKMRRYHTSATDEQINQFIDKMKEATTKKDKEAFAKLLIYPCRLNEGKQKTLIKDESQFMEVADRVMLVVTPFILKIRLDELFVNSIGFMVGNGEIWFDPLRGIMTFNLPNEPKEPTSWNPLNWVSKT